MTRNRIRRAGATAAVAGIALALVATGAAPASPHDRTGRDDRSPHHGSHHPTPPDARSTPAGWMRDGRP